MNIPVGLKPQIILSKEEGFVMVGMYIFFNEFNNCGGNSKGIRSMFIILWVV